MPTSANHKNLQESSKIQSSPHTVLQMVIFKYHKEQCQQSLSAPFGLRAEFWGSLYKFPNTVSPWNTVSRDL